MTKKILSLSFFICLVGALASCTDADTLTNSPATEIIVSNNNVEKILIFNQKGGDAFLSGEYSEFFEMLLDGSIKSIEFTYKKDTTHCDFKNLMAYFTERLENGELDSSYVRCLAENVFHSFEFNEEMSVNGEIWFDHYTSSRYIWKYFPENYGRILKNTLTKYQFVRGDDNELIGICYHFPATIESSMGAILPNYAQYSNVRWTPWRAEKLIFNDGNLYLHRSYYNSWEASQGIFEVEFTTDGHNDLLRLWKKTSDDSFDIHFDRGGSAGPVDRIADLKITRK